MPFWKRPGEPRALYEYLIVNVDKKINGFLVFLPFSYLESVRNVLYPTLILWSVMSFMFSILLIKGAKKVRIAHFPPNPRRPGFSLLDSIILVYFCRRVRICWEFGSSTSFSRLCHPSHSTPGSGSRLTPKFALSSSGSISSLMLQCASHFSLSTSLFRTFSRLEIISVAFTRERDSLRSRHRGIRKSLYNNFNSKALYPLNKKGMPNV
jgi:hypothetical protein